MNILLVPGFMTDAALWDDMLPALQDLGPITHGDTTYAETIADMAQHVLIDAPEQFALVGFSMGGYVAREIARIAPERVLALVLVATSARADTPEQTRRKAVSVKMAELRRFTSFSRPGILISLHPDRVIDEPLIERVRAMSERVGGDVFRRHTLQFRETDLDRLDAVRCPTLVVAGDRDALRSFEEAQELCAGIDGATMVLIKGSGHMIPMEQPAALTETIIPWLRTHAAPPDRKLRP
jgi:pimeloyl-ACP methyl ester carboxylesterase